MCMDIESYKHQYNFWMSVSAILDKIIKPEFRTKFNNWEAYAKPIDIFGLECINQIYNTKGARKLKAVMFKPHQHIDMQTTKGSRFLGETDAKINPMATSYKFYHGSTSLSKQTRPSIFQFKSLNQLKIARPLNPMTVTFIDNWLLQKDSKDNEEAVMNCLRSLTSKLRLADPYSTEMKTSYDGRSDWSLSKPIRMDKAGEDLFAFKPNVGAIQKQERKKQEHRQKMKELASSDFAKQLHIFKEFKIN